MSGLPDPNDPGYEAARQLMARHLRQIGEEDARNGYTEMADDLLAGNLMQVPTWLALGLIANATSEKATLEAALRDVCAHFDGGLRDKDWLETERLVRTALDDAK